MTSAKVRTVDLGDPAYSSLDGLCEFLLVRHAEQRIYDNIKLGEAFDAPLSDLGQRQAAAVGSRLADAGIDAIYCSPTRRAHETARAIGKPYSIEPTVREDLHEIDLWKKAPQDKGILDIFGRDGVIALYRDFDQTRKFSSYPYVEDVDAFRERIIGTVNEIADANLGRRVAIVCHGGVINVYLSHLFASTVDQVVAVHHTSISTVRAAGSRRAVFTVNDYSHVLSL